MTRVSALMFIAFAGLPACRSQACDDAKQRLKGTIEAPWYLDEVNRACPADDSEARELVTRAKAGVDERAKKARLQEEEIRQQNQAARAKALAELRDFWTYAEVVLKAPAKGPGGEIECYSGNDPDAGWCARSSSNTLHSVKWLGRNPKAVKADSDGVTRAFLGCVDIDPSATVVRSWRWPQANKIQTHCRIGAGRFAGFEALIQLAELSSFVSLFSPEYLENDLDLSETLRSQGETIENGPAATAQSAEAAARTVFLVQIARAMSETRDPPHATGPDQTILVPSSDATKCLLWGSMWQRDTADSLRQMGFKEMRCGSKVWKL